MEWLSDPQAWLSLLTLTALEIVLGIDNIIFVSILAGRLPEHQRNRARTIGLLLAMGTRILLLISITWVIGLTEPLFTLLVESEYARAISGRDLILFGGGLFLLAKSTHEIHATVEGDHETEHKPGKVSSFVSVLVQIAILDIVFSLDSVITAVGMAEHLAVMVIAIVISVGIMQFAAKTISDFVDRHPTLKMLALSFLILVGVTLVAEGLAFHIPKGYIYFAMIFSLGVEILNIRARKRKKTPTTN
ncbi:TerC family protein [Parendozoicomonas haliclonae]|uniref:Integral membrane protein TerC family protein n=1 Tax=Parendozoicomonas haliclonae TaxID=1960125 RepID=A0A1X7AMU7_9GAMM|nr:TerC family protein [Parendozoicomonas haliclonae]SMA49322.1 Integral membrane protein TerC family protein [Parendozoicomonas haliclonae]